MKILLLVIFLSICLTSQAEVVLYRYYDLDTGEEMGIGYSDINGKPSTNNLDVGIEVISEAQKEDVIAKQKKQQADKNNLINARKNTDKKTLKAKLSDMGLTQPEIEILIED